MDRELTRLTNPTVHLSHIPHCTVQNRIVHTSILNDVLWDIGQGHCGICDIGLLLTTKEQATLRVSFISLGLYVEHMSGQVTWNARNCDDICVVPEVGIKGRDK